MIEINGGVIEWADYFQRIGIQEVNGDVVITVEFDSDSQTIESTVNIPKEQFKELLGYINREYGQRNS